MATSLPARAGLALAAFLAASSAADAAPRHGLQGARPGGTDTITLFAGPCRGGGCAVYRVALRSDGVMTYSGLAHTNVLGTRKKAVGREAYAELASTLSPYRSGGPDVSACSAGDGRPTYRITWSGAHGMRSLFHSLGCNTAHDNVLDAILVNAPARLGFDDWSAPQQTPAMLVKPHIFYF